MESGRTKTSGSELRSLLIVFDTKFSWLLNYGTYEIKIFMNIIMEGLRINLKKKMNEIYLKTAAIDQLLGC